jgi:hypothetical protein
LSGYRIGDPIATFYSQRSADVSDRHSRQDVMLAAPEDLAERMQRSGVTGNVGGGSGAGVAAPPPAPAAPKNGREFQSLQLLADLGRGQEQIRTRENFDALATFAPAVPTDSNGRATVKVKLPDSRPVSSDGIAVAGGKQFGAKESISPGSADGASFSAALQLRDKIERPSSCRTRPIRRWMWMSRFGQATRNSPKAPGAG